MEGREWLKAYAIIRKTKFTDILLCRKMQPLRFLILFILFEIQKNNGAASSLPAHTLPKRERTFCS